MKRIITSIMIVAGMSASAQQDPHYSQFYSAPTTLNPATAGVFEGDLRLVTTYRNQWGAISGVPYQTIMASGDMPVIRTSGGRFGFGFDFYNDVAGDSRLTTNNFNGSFSYAHELDRENYLGVGFSFGMFQRSVNPDDLNWENQWNGAEFDQNAFSGEALVSQSFAAFDVGAGVYYRGLLTDDLRITGGAGLKHVNRPNVTFLGAEEKLLMKVTLHGGAEINMSNSNMAVLPNALVVLQGPNRLINVGTDIKYIIQQGSRALVFNDEISAGIGGYLRVGDAFYMTGKFQYAGFAVGAAYDMNLSGLTVATNGVGGFEVYLKYVASFGSGGDASFR